jgi:16S rRNA (cytosine967-C5)-methyltransferase
MFVVQGEASQLVSELTGARPGERVLDLCAAPGGKTTHLAALVGAEGLVVATDVHPGRLRLLAAAVKRAGASNVAVKLADATAPLDALTNAHGRFDRVLVDAPCTAMGTLARHPEIKWRLDRADPRRLSETQIAILRRAAECVRSGGVLLYSVCSMSGEETERVVLRFLTERSDYALDDLRREFAPRYGVFLQETGAFLSLPHQSTAEGMFAARFVRE